jgi:hypothetical protein
MANVLKDEKKEAPRAQKATMEARKRKYEAARRKEAQVIRYVQIPGVLTDIFMIHHPVRRRVT